MKMAWWGKIACAPYLSHGSTTRIGSHVRARITFVSPYLLVGDVELSTRDVNNRRDGVQAVQIHLRQHCVIRKSTVQQTRGAHDKKIFFSTDLIRVKQMPSDLRPYFSTQERVQSLACSTRKLKIGFPSIVCSKVRLSMNSDESGHDVLRVAKE